MGIATHQPEDAADHDADRTRIPMASTLRRRANLNPTPKAGSTPLRTRAVTADIPARSAASSRPRAVRDVEGRDRCNV